MSSSNQVIDSITNTASFIQGSQIASWTPGGTTGQESQICISFTGNGMAITQAKFYLIASGTPTVGTNPQFVARIYNSSGSLSGGVPTGNVLTESSVVTFSQIPTTQNWVIFNFDGAFTTTSGNIYIFLYYLALVRV
ncbi:MAG: hypothetical protein LBE76_05040 [Nitrososphaerota archaeon]|jgi:hypothetical protein|nr:hypothetical protein [Nitrososphaerota archaeon]